MLAYISKADKKYAEIVCSTLDEIKIYAERTAGIVEQGRKTGIDFGMMVDMMSQEVGIIDDMVKKARLFGLFCYPKFEKFL